MIHRQNIQNNLNTISNTEESHGFTGYILIPLHTANLMTNECILSLENDPPTPAHFRKI